MEERKDEKRIEQVLWHKIECMLFVAGDPVAITELARVLDLPMPKTRNLLSEMEYSYRVEGRGVQLLVTHDTAQLVSNRDYIEEVKQLVNPDETKNVSQSLLETLAVIAYRQPVTRSRIAAVRGVNVDGVMRTLVARGLTVECGTDPDTGGMLYRTTELFLERLGLTSLDELPDIAPLLPDVDLVDEMSDDPADDPRIPVGRRRNTAPDPTPDDDEEM